MSLSLTWLFRAIHAVSAALLAGGMFLNIFVVVPSAHEIFGSRRVPLEFLVTEARRLVFWLYLALGAVLVTGIAIMAIQRPFSFKPSPTLIVKTIAWSIFTGNVIYGTIVTWPKLQFSTNAEAVILYRKYKMRALINLGCSVMAIVVSAFHA